MWRNAFSLVATGERPGGREKETRYDNNALNAST